MERYRLTVFRSNKHLYAQIIDDGQAKTLASSSDLELGKNQIKGKKPVEVAQFIGDDLATKLLKKKIIHLKLDKNKFRYHGQIAALTDALRKKGIKI